MHIPITEVIGVNTTYMRIKGVNQNSFYLNHVEYSLFNKNQIITGMCFLFRDAFFSQFYLSCPVIAGGSPLFQIITWCSSGMKVRERMVELRLSPARRCANDTN